MLDLDSPRWQALAAVGGPSRVVPDLLLRLATEPSEDDWVEVFEQIAHQWTLEPAAYAAVPHLVRLMKEQGRLATPWALCDLARVAAPLERTAECPADLLPDFQAALDEARVVAEKLAGAPGHDPADYPAILCAAGALSGRPVLGRLSLNACVNSDELCVVCPECTSELEATYISKATRMTLELGEAPTRRAKTTVRPGCEKSAAANSEFGWAARAAIQARQDLALGWIRCIWGTAACPVCHAEFLLADNLG